MRALFAATLFAAGCFSKPPAPDPSTQPTDAAIDGPPVLIAGGRRRVVSVAPAPAPLTRFPFHISLDDDADMIAHAQGATNIAFATMQDELLPCEVVLYQAGDLDAWVTIPTLPTQMYQFQLIYGADLSVTAACTPQAAWADYSAVWHLGDTNFDTFADSSPNGYTLRRSSGTPQPAGGIVGTATELDNADGTADEACVDAMPGLQFDERSFTYELWVYPKALIDDYDVALYKGAKNMGAPGFDLELGMGDWTAWIRDSRIDADPTVGRDSVSFTQNPMSLVNAWSHLVAVVDREAKELRAYLNGVPTETEQIDVLSVTGPAPLCVGDQTQPSRAIIDEVRIREGAMTTAWVNTAYRNITDASFYTIGPPLP